MDHKLKLMVVDDSPLFRTWLIHSLSEDDRFQVVGYAINAFDAQEKIPQLQPDMLTLDIEMPGMSGIDFLKQLLPVHPIPVILVSSLNLRVFDALEAGAVDFVRKPDEANGLSKEIFLLCLFQASSGCCFPCTSPIRSCQSTGSKKTDSLSFNCGR